MTYVIKGKKLRLVFKSYDGKIVKAPIDWEFLKGKPVNAFLKFFTKMKFKWEVLQ